MNWDDITAQRSRHGSKVIFAIPYVRNGERSYLCSLGARANGQVQISIICNAAKTRRDRWDQQWASIQATPDQAWDILRKLERGWQKNYAKKGPDFMQKWLQAEVRSYARARSAVQNIQERRESKQ